ncbi:hypothetical protein [Deinococcus budaensis]|uniref:Uncharacterized protein n=1 Tax=Deinococcus budaensis TaxID=1665626 RepID=A0A7W8GF55_9DEIO|nr:hypothetical protein [Deinococcus budaensis]MBB5234512.1 hypothetical protein [Deinococcus budaensis]
MDTTTPRAKTRTWKAITVDTEYGVVRSISHQVVTLTRDGLGQLSATVDGQLRGYADATWILDNATRTELLHEILLPIGKAAACQLHRELGVLGYRSATHYALAAEVLGVSVPSLAALTTEEAALTRSYAYAQTGRAA